MKLTPKGGGEGKISEAGETTERIWWINRGRGESGNDQIQTCRMAAEFRPEDPSAHTGDKNYGNREREKNRSTTKTVRA